MLMKIFFFTGKISNGTAFLKPLSAEKEKLYFEKAKAGDKEAEEKLVEHNLRLVAHIVKKYKNSGYESEELISIGSIGLLKAVRSYNITHGNNFSTYASKCITNEILMLIRADKKRLHDISLDSEIAADKDGNSVTVKDILSPIGESLEEKIETKVMAANLIKLMKQTLSEREYKVLDLRYGLSSGVPKTQNEIASMLGISRSYISRIETYACGLIKSKVKDIL